MSEVPDPEELDSEQYCYLTTTGRRSGRDHTIEIWFSATESALYLISGGGVRSDWVANLLASPAATVRIGDTHLGVEARLPLSASPERSEAIRRLHSKYGTQVSSSAADWESDAYIVALDLRF